MIENLEIKIESQINSLETRTEKMQEQNKDTHYITFIQHNIESSSQSNWAINSQFQIGKKEVKLSPCTDDMIIYKENSKDSI